MFGVRVASPRLSARGLLALAALALITPGCSSVCKDDGFAWNQDLEACASGASATESGTDGSTTAGSSTDSSASSSASSAPTGTDSSGSESDAGPGTDSDSDSETDSETGVTTGDTCNNGVKDGDETDVDCGGSCGNTCEVGQACLIHGDCATNSCDPDEGVCTPNPTCENGVQDDDETDIDCGGACGANCDIDDGCFADTDCASGFCDPDDNTCQPPSCDDGVMNGDETDVDCGGACGATCLVGEVCVIDDDCVTMLCEGGTCAPPGTCNNGVLDMGETDIDCGGVCGSNCMIDDDCLLHTDCESLYCDPDPDTCQQPSCDDGIKNGDETDVDCGGPCGPTCDDGELCNIDDDCVSMACSGLGECVPPVCVVTDMDNECRGCIKESCCDSVADCVLDPDCSCWLDCIEYNNDFDPCKTQCGINGNPGPITACANSKCNFEGACAKP
ncbi:MAG: hypothetical protein KC636_27360 [Myxococcales bacterium]|nr:hypothetical protein [Myxococcales bacterium]